MDKIGCGYEKWEADGIISPVTAVECEYKRPTTFGDEICVSVEVSEYKRVKLTISYTMLNTASGEQVCIGKSHHCFISADGKPVALSRQYPEYDELLKKQLTKND